MRAAAKHRIGGIPVAAIACRSSVGSTTGAILPRPRPDLAAWLSKWSSRYPRLTTWAEEALEHTLTFFRLPRQHHKHLKSTNMLERPNEEIRRRAYVVRIFLIWPTIALDL